MIKLLDCISKAKSESEIKDNIKGNFIKKENHSLRSLFNFNNI